MPIIAASWVAGQYDNDKSVSRAANESFKRVFSSEEKLKNVWRLYQIPILEYAMDVILKETSSTLSDERTTSPDDSSAKYSRVVGASITMVTNLIESTSEADLEKSQTLISDFLSQEKLWQFASDSDGYVRRSLYRLLGTILANYKNILNPSTISASVLVSGLHTAQSGSAFDYAKILALLSIELPDVWTTYYPGSGKKSAENRLCYFLKKGSQGGPPEFWSQIAALLSNLPPSIIVRPAGTESSNNVDGGNHSSTPVLNALHDGLNSKDEPRANMVAAWNAYLTASDVVISSVPDAATRRRILTHSVLPILAQYIRPSSDNSRWAIAGAQEQEVAIRACSQAILRDAGAFEAEWNALSTMIIEDIKTSLPEQAKDYIKSQDAISAEAERWYSLQSALPKSSPQDAMSAIFQITMSSELSSAISVLKARNGKPYGAAAALNMLIKNLPDVVLGDEGCKAKILQFVDEDLPNLLFSPSARYLIRIMDLLDASCDISRSYEKSMRMLAEAPESASRSIALQSFISSPRLATTDSLSAIVLVSLGQAMKEEDSEKWNLVMAAISNPVAPRSLTDEVLANMTEGLSISSDRATGLYGLEMTMKKSPSKVTEFARSSQGSSLLSKLLLMGDSYDDEIAQRAKNASTMIEKAISAQGGTGLSTNSLIETITRGLDTAEAVSLSYVGSSSSDHMMKTLTV